MARRNAERSGDGRFERSPDSAEKRALAAKLRAKSMPWAEVAEKAGYASAGAAHTAVAKFYAESPQQTIKEIRDEFRTKLEGLEVILRDVIDRPHYVVERGQFGPELVMKDGEYLVDDAPILNAVDKIRALVETQLKFMPGVAASTKVQVITDDDIADALSEARAELDQLDSGGSETDG